MINKILSQEIFQKISELSKNSMQTLDPAHDYSHVLRVLNNCIKIASVEGGDLEILTAAAFLHDICNFPKNHPKRKFSSEESAKKAEEILLENGFDQNKIEKVKEAILCHSFSRGLIPQSLEGKIFQDADRLDAIGAIGTARAYATGASFKAKLYSIQDPFCKSKRKLNDKENTLDHFSVKLFNLEKTMLTQTGKKLAQERNAFMKIFVQNLEKELL